MSNYGLKISVLIVSMLYVNGCSVGDIDMSFITSEIQCPFQSGGGNYYIIYNPCIATIECGTSRYIAIQQYQINPRENCWYLISTGDEPTTLSTETFHGDKAYVAQYTNGQADQGQPPRKLDIRFFCSDSDYDQTKTTCNEVGTAEYYLEIYTINACTATEDSSSNRLSAGWIFVIWYINVHDSI